MVLSRLVSAGLLAAATSAAVAAEPVSLDIAQPSGNAWYGASAGLGSGGLTVAQQDPLLVTAPPPSGADVRGPSAVASSTRWHLPSLGGNSQLSADIFTGFLYETDANQAAQALALGVNAGTPVIVTPEMPRKQSDWSFVTRANLSHTYRFSGRQQQTWETNIGLSDQRFFHISHNYDLTQVEADTGPRFTVAKVGRSTISVRPFGSFAWIGYGERTYSSLYGGGLSAQVSAPQWGAALTGIGRFGNYEDSPFRPDTRPFTGPEFLLTASSRITVNPATEVSASLFWYQANGRTSAFSRQGPGASVSMVRKLTFLHRTAELAINGWVQQLNFGEPAPQNPPEARRRDTQWIGSSSLSIPLSPPGRPILSSMRAVVEYQYFRNYSNVSPLVDHSFTVGIKAVL